MTILESIEEYTYSCLNLSARTQGYYAQKLQVFARWCEDNHLTLDKLNQRILRQWAEFVRKGPLGREISTHTQHGYLQVVKGFLHWCSQEEGLENVVSESLYRKVPMNKIEHKVIEVFTDQQIRAMLDVAKKEYNADMIARDRALICVLADTGIRATELLTLTTDNCFLSMNGGYLRVHGKGNKWREVPLGNQSLAALRKYITRHRLKVAGSQVFLNRSDQPLTLSGLEQLVRRLGEWAHVRGVRCSPHTFRHTYAVNYLRAGGDIYQLKTLMGHSSVTVTEIYVQTSGPGHARSGGISVLDRM